MKLSVQLSLATAGAKRATMITKRIARVIRGVDSAVFGGAANMSPVSLGRNSAVR